MNKTVTILLGLAAGTAFALVATSKRGKRVRSKITKRVSEFKENMASTIEEKAKMAYDSTVLYS